MSDFDLPTSGSSVALSLIDLWVVAAVIRRDGRILAAKRREGGPSGLKWEFPGGKLELGETPQQALAREIEEELGMSVEVGDEIGTFPTVLGRHRIHLQCFWCTVFRGDPVLHTHEDVRWCLPEELSSLDWALPDIPALERIQRVCS